MSQHGGGAQKDKEEKRQIILTYKALHNKVESKLEEADKLSDQLKSLLQSEESREQTSSDCLSSLEALTLAYDNTVQELVSLYKQDKNHELEEGKLAAHEKYLNYVNMVVKKIKNRLSDKLSETSWPRERATKATRSVKSTDSRRSRLSSSLSTSSTARLRALSEAAAAKKEAEYKRAIAQRKLELKRREIEYEHEIAFLSAAQKEAVAYARLEAIDEALLDDPEERKNICVAENNALSSERVSAWVNASENSPLSRPHIKDPAAQNHVDFTLPSPQTALRPPFASTAIFNDITGSQLVEALTLSNEHIVSGLARQSLPKCHPDVFGGDPTLFHPWKAAFKAMIQDANVSPQREINYLHKYTSGEVRQVVDNFRKRIQSNPVGLLSDVWKELEKRFGSAAVITNALLSNLLRAAEFKENEHAKLQRFADVCADVDSQISHLPGLACLNFPNAIAPIVGKLPASLKGKWEKEVVAFAEQNDDRYPSFSRFKKVIERQAKIKNHPNLSAGLSPQSSAPKGRPQPTGFGPSAQTLFTNTSPLKTFEHAPPEGNEGKTRFCHFHQREGHTFSECKAFGDKTLEERSDFILKAGLCFKCLSENCRAVSCKAHTTCSICGDKRHIALLHKDKTAKEVESVEAKCTTICSGEGGGLSCSKIVLVDLYSKQAPNSFKRVYAVLDDQSNASLISSELADELGADGPVEKYYLSTCSGETAERYGRRVNSIYVRSLNGYTSELPTLVECESIPSDRREIPTPQTARRFPHLCSLASEIQPLDDQAGIHVLIGRDAPELLKVREFRNGPRGAPWAQRHSLGWTISGQVCLDMTDGPKHVRTNRTTVNAQVQVYSLEPCPNAITVKESFGEKRGDEARRDVFHTTQEDNEPTLSREDKKFLELMESGIHRNASGNWEMPLPFRDPAPHMPNNRSQAESRLKGLLKTLKRKPDMQNHYIEFMSKVIGKSHASPVPPAEIQASSGRVFYLSHFGVYHPKKPGSLRVVFDSSLEFRGVSLNKALIPGPDRMNVHLFGNGPSPAIATFGLRKTVNHGEEEYTREVKQFVNRNFYVDDGLASVPSAREAIDLVEETQTALATRNLRLHKVVSNVPAVVEAFPADDRAKDIRDLDLRNDALPVQRSLEVHWDLEHDSFTFKVSLPDKPFTRRGVLAVVNSVYDPLGLAAPAILEGRKLLQNLVAMGKHVNGEEALGWDDPLPEELALRWTNWKDCLKDLESVSVPRCYKPKESWDVTRAEVHAFSDASKNAIGAAVYLRLFNDQGETSVSLVYGQAKVAPIHPTSIPRLELCGAVLATEAARKVTQELDMEIATVKYYTDSKVVLGYIKNDTRRFHVYVANRVQTIRNLSQPDQWEYVESSVNPADQATRGLKPDQLMESSWIKGPDFLRNGDEVNMPIDIQVPDEADPEVRREITAHKTSLQRGDGLGTERFSRFSSLTSLQRALARLITKIREFKQRRGERSKRVTRRTNSSATDVPKLTTRDGERNEYFRPVKELILLMPVDSINE